MERVARRAHVGGENGAGRFKARVPLFPLAVFSCDLQELAVVRLAPIPARPFSLLDNGVITFFRTIFPAKASPGTKSPKFFPLSHL